MKFLAFILIGIISSGESNSIVNPAEETREAIIDMALKSLQEQYDEDEYRFSVSARWMPGSLLKNDPEQIESVKLSGSLSKYTVFEVTYRNRSALEKTEVQLAVVTEKILPVLKERKVPGEKLNDNDLDWNWVEINPSKTEPISAVQALIGKTLRRTINAGNPVFDSEISSSFMVEAGELVNLVFDEHGIQIVLSCEARQDGALDDEISIYCKETRRKYEGKITGPGEAKWQKTY